MNVTRVTIALLLVGGGVGGGYIALNQPFSQGIQEPEVTVADIGDWGEVTDTSISLVHTLNVRNPNPVGIDIGNGTTLKLRVQLNGIEVGSVEKSGLDVSQGNNTVSVRSRIQQRSISEFWARFINDDETIHAEVYPTMEVDAGPGFTVSPAPVRVSALNDRRPVSTALSETGEEIEGSYTVPTAGSRTAEYTVEDVRFEWGRVTSEETTLRIHLNVRNTGETRLPGVPENVASDILLNDVEVFHARSSDTTIDGIDPEDALKPNETASYVLIAKSDNENIERWFTTYARRGEQSTVRTEFQLLFDVNGLMVSIPSEGGAVAYECRFQTGIFNDTQETSTNCGNGTIKAGGQQFPIGENQSRLPIAVPTVSPTSGDAPLTVSLNASGSLDPDGEIDQYNWTFENGTLLGTGMSIKRPLPAGEYTIQLEVVDDDDNRNSSSVDITVENRTVTPTARFTASPTSGEAALTVSFDASDSTDPDGDIARYVWRFDDGTSPTRGENVEHRFRTAGEYEVQLTVVDESGNRDATTQVITVERPTR